MKGNNDRLKFRAWDSSNKGMVFNNVYAGDNGAILTTSRKALGANTFFYLKESSTIIMQCTGLKDEDGKLIYEGDIVQFFDGFYHVNFDEKEGLIGQYIKKRDLFISMREMYCKKDKINIIGNIHENPDLLK